MESIDIDSRFRDRIANWFKIIKITTICWHFFFCNIVTKNFFDIPIYDFFYRSPKKFVKYNLKCSYQCIYQCILNDILFVIKQYNVYIKMDNSISRIDTTAIGITLIGVILGISVTISLSLRNISVWLRIFIGVLIFSGLVILVKTLTHNGTGPISKAGGWIMNVPS